MLTLYQHCNNISAGNKITANFNFISLLTLFPKFAVMSIYFFYNHKIIKMFQITLTRYISSIKMSLLWVWSKHTGRVA